MPSEQKCLTSSQGCEIELQRRVVVVGIVVILKAVEFAEVT